MDPHTTLKGIPPTIDDEYDIIISGGGTSGGVVAGRLAATDPNLRILVLECGPHTLNMLDHVQPGRNSQHLLPETSTMRFHMENGGDALGNRLLVVPTGQCLGGGSATNYTMYNRSFPSDYDDWEEIYNNPGWGFVDLFPLMKKTETYEIKPDDPTHGYEGPIKVGYGGWYQPYAKEYLDMARQYDKERAGTDDDDTNDFKTINKFVVRSSPRSDVAHNFLYNQSDNKNLHIATYVYVNCVIFEGTRAVGVEYQWNQRFLPNADKNNHVVRAKRMVLLSSGTFSSPGILERSGIGSSEVLKKNNIETFVDLPGVGENYQDHNSVFATYVADPEAQTLDPINRNEPEAMAAANEEWEKTRTGPLASNGVDVGIKFRPFPHEAASMGPEYLKRYNEYLANAPDKVPFLMVFMGFHLGNSALVEPQSYFAMVGYHAYPLARGSVHVTSADDASAPVDFKSGFFRRVCSLIYLALKFFYKYTRELARRAPSFRGEYAPLHPTFPTGSKASLSESKEPVPLDAPKLEYNEDDEKALETWIRKTSGTTFHSMGTCAMKPREDGGVVDNKLNVYGTQGLKVAGILFHCPANVSSNTYSVALTIGEKAAAIIAEELGITGF
ncbi:alcohol oxidase-like protein [Desarmillaria tabescens]|uniref:Alcohol oxidase-like protein n=1 Tax=Armillaria tabescens TaxID=1929756 RepID=A0AA39N3Y9_ARMTA|nr:alcohol oxidase-like protein [Desarmillaria tabescens]KAK0457321.1 alcohol oxidase-like protein [Desarmillaria tabescens]